ncbi:LOW QUALITY PROTEIN: trichohyalin-like [Dermacentor silvarum]|uniref:LOW QUALITY PROTEIN: trichohyalin-like n=1 Tax=Dermacentor silvarum TaxID=543639 RepID=UPI0018991763|nr:LOW QUALITY PROTEIN: trichohyalin-like [Dermacentor silvarum]
MSAGECPGFVPHFAKASRCKRCFRDVSEHGKPTAAAPATAAKTTTNERQPGKLPGQNRRDSCPSPQNTRVAAGSSPSPASPAPAAGQPKAAKSPTAATAANATQEEEAKAVVRRRRTAEDSEDAEEEVTSVKLRRRRPHSAEIGDETATNGRSRSSADSSRLQVSKSDSESQSSDTETQQQQQQQQPQKRRPSSYGAKERRRSQRIKIVEAQEVEKGPSPSLPSDSATVASPSADVEFILKVKTTASQQKEERDDDDDDGSLALTETTETTDTTLAYYDSYEDMENTVAKLKSQLAAAEDKVQRLEKEKLEMQKRRSEVTDTDKKTLEKTASEILKLRSKINELETINEELKDDNKCLKLEVKELQQEVDKRDLEEDVKKEAEALKVKLQQAETLCEELMEENEEIKKEVQDLEEQLEELQDSYREDQQSEYQDLKKELESTSKNCRVLQFKLRKAERRCEQLELEKGQLDDKVSELQKTAQIEVDKTRMKVLEDELHVANELSVKLATELEVFKDAKTKLEMDNAALKKQMSSGAKGVTVSQASKSKEAVMGKDYETMCKDLYDSMERETDLREQLRFAEEENKTMRRKLNNIEQENETLMLQIRKLSGKRDSLPDNSDSDEEVSLEELRMQYELQEQETSVLRRKVEEKEQQIEGLEKEVKYLQEKLVSQPFTKVELPAPPKNEADVDVYHRQKAKLLEYEARELRQKLIEKERENERLQTEIEVHRRKASKVIVRSRSLDSELQVDLKRQLQLVEQEANILRQKAQDLETENDKLMAENKRCQLRLSRKPPPGPQELLQLDNMELKEKLADAERKLKVLKEELEKVAAGAAPSAVVIQEYAPKKEKPSDIENDLIAGLKKKVRAKEEETSALQTKIVQLEVENSRVNREFKKLKDALNYKKRAPRAVRETATRGELKDIIRDLEDEISELYVTLRSREVTQEGMAEEVESAKKALEEAQLKAKQQEAKMASELECLKQKVDKQQEDVQKERKKADAFKKQLESMMKGSAGGPAVAADVIEKVASLQVSKRNAAKKQKELEQKLTQEQNKYKELEQRMGVMSKLNESLAASVKLLESKGKELEEELEKRKKALQSAETQAKLLKGKLESTESGYTQLKKECSNLRAELQEAKSKDVNASTTSPAQAGITWTKEREELKRKLEDMRQTLDVMTRKEIEKEKQFQEKENRLKQEHEKKLEKKLKEVREFLQAEVRTLQEEHASMKNRLNETIDKFEKKENELKTVSDKLRQLSNSQRRERDDWQHKMEDLEEKLRTELRKRERMEREHELESKSKAEDVLAAQNRVVQLEREHRRLVAKLQEMEQEHAEQRKQMEKDAAKEREEYDDLTTRYEVLEEEFLTMKNNLTLEKGQLDAALKQLRKEHERISAELRSVKETLNARQELYTREKTEFQNLIRELEARVTRLKDIEAERNRMRSNLNERDAIIEELKKTDRCFREEKEKLRRKNEELMKRVAELERSERHLRTLTVGGAKTDAPQPPMPPQNQQLSQQQQQELRARLEHSGHVHKAEQAALRADFEGRVNFMAAELQALQAQVASLARERDQCREKLDEAAREMEQLRANSARKERSRGKEAFDSMQKKAEELRAYADDLKNQLEESLTDNRKLRIQMEADKSSWEIQLSNLKSKLNQYEERNILEASRGSAKLYAKTRLELAWEKERTDLQKVLGDTQAALTDLRQRLLSAEAQREAERETAEKTIQELRKKVEWGQNDVSKDIVELQTDLEELKDTHGRLKTQYDRLRREKERLDREREDLRHRAAATLDVQALVTDLVEDVNRMGDLVKLEGIFAADQGKAKAAQRPLRTGSTPKDDLVSLVQKVAQRTERLREVSKPVRDEDMIRRTTSFRRALSATDMANQGGLMPGMAPVIRAPPRTRGGMHSKTMSLGQGMAAADLRIWGSGDSLVYTPYGSQNSLRGGRTGYDSDASVVSEPPRHWRYSRPAVRVESENESSNPGSTEDVTTATKHRKTLKERLKLLKKPSTHEPKQDSDKEDKSGTLRARLTKPFRSRSKEKIDTPSPSASERRPVLAQQKLEPVQERAPVERSNSLSAKKDKGSKKSLLGRLTSKESPAKTTTTTAESPNSKPPATPVRNRKGSFNETPV